MSEPGVRGRLVDADLGDACDGGVRRRLLDGLAAGIRARGYPATTVADIVRVAGTSRRTFYEQFRDRDDCFLALLDDLQRRQVHLITGSVDLAAPWQEQVRQAIAAWLHGIRSEPALARSWIRDAPGLGPAHGAQERAHQQLFVGLMDGLIRSAADDPGAPGPLSPARATILVGGLRELVASTVEDGGDVGDLEGEAFAAATALLTSAEVAV